MEKIDRRYYLVRTGREFVNKDIVAIGWSWVNFTEYANANEIIAKIGKHIGRYGNQIRRFIAIKEGDVVIVPLPQSVAIGISTNEMVYSAENQNDRANQKRVKFFKDVNGKPLIIPRVSFSEAFQRRLRVQGITVNDLGEFKTQIEQKLLEFESGQILSLNDKASSEFEHLENVFKKTLLRNIQHGKINFQTGGVGLEELVTELLVADGYTAEILSKQAFLGKADADIKASKSDKVSETNILVQVKHHHGITSSWGVEQLKAIRTIEQKKDYSYFQLVLITSGAVSESLRKDAADNNITVIDGEELVDWIFDSINKLSDETKIKLGICEVPQIATFS